MEWSSWLLYFKDFISFTLAACHLYALASLQSTCKNMQLHEGTCTHTHANTNAHICIALSGKKNNQCGLNHSALCKRTNLTLSLVEKACSQNPSEFSAPKVKETHNDSYSKDSTASYTQQICDTAAKEIKYTNGYEIRIMCVVLLYTIIVFKNI